MNRPYVFINVAASADGKIDTVARRGAAISSLRDKERVDALRASADAILIGGQTLRHELPKLTVKSEALREARIKLGKSPNPIKVGVITRADIPLKSDFMEAGAARKIIFTTGQTSKKQIAALQGAGAEVFIHSTRRVNLKRALQTLKKLGVERLMIEGGGTINFEILRLGLADELTIYLAPKIFGGASAPTLADGLGFSAQRAVSLRLANLEQDEDGGVLLKYARKD